MTALKRRWLKEKKQNVAVYFVADKKRLLA
jgi:hypothetical protein